MFDSRRLEDLLRRDLHTLRGARLCAAYSGGMDSHVLVHALAAARERCGFVLRAVHVDHGLHPDSALWAEHCRGVCTALGLPLEIVRVRVQAGAGRSLEHEARRMRYGALGERLGSGECLLTAHHLDDQAETVLLMLMRGAGVRGLGGMQAAQAFAHGQLLRPLLTVQRSALAAYAARKELAWIDDSSNQDTRRSRNYVRHVVLPALRGHWPEAASTLARGAGQAREASTLLDEVAEQDLAACTCTCPGMMPATLGCLSVAALRRLGVSRLRNALRVWLRKLDLAPPPARRLDEAVSQLVFGEAAGCVAWDHATLRRYRGVLVAVRELPAAPVGALSWPEPAPLAVPWAGLVLTPRTVTGRGLARSAWERAVSVGPRKLGATCRPAKGAHHRRLKVLFQEMGVPPWERARLPMVYVDGQLAWVPGIGACGPYAAAEGEEGVVIDIEEHALDDEFR
jgi:tRNA(Ile)-lysidine synthase